MCREGRYWWINWEEEENVNIKKQYNYKPNIDEDNWDAETGNGADALFASGAGDEAGSYNVP